MINDALKKGYLPILLFLALGCISVDPSTTWAQQPTHRVEKGDTLWSICDKYYGDPELWSKLWQMNPFITNPHILKIGDVITLLEEIPVREIKRAVEAEKKKPPPIKREKPEPELKGIDISAIININTLGYFSPKKIKPLGKIFASKSGKIMFSKGDTTYVILDRADGGKKGDEFAISQISPRLKHPVTGKYFGYTLSVHGKLVIVGPAGLLIKKDGMLKNRKSFEAKITEIFQPIFVDDPLLLYERASTCVQPIPINGELRGNIIAAKDQQALISRYSIVYINQGFNQGVQRGHIFEVMKKNIVANPELKENPFADKKIMLPNRVIGIIMVLESRPDTATSVVLVLKEDITNGAFIREVSWVESPQYLSALPRCSIE